MNCNAKSLCITSIMLMTMSKNPALSQKVLEDWLRLPERQDLFPGLPITVATVTVTVTNVTAVCRLGM